MNGWQERLAQERAQRRVGVWIEGGKVLCRNHEQDYAPDVFTPKTPEELAITLRLVRQRQGIIAGGGGWGTQGEAAVAELLQQIRQHTMEPSV